MPLRVVDEHGEVQPDPRYPLRVQDSDEHLERWIRCVKIAAAVSRQPELSQENSYFASWLYDSPIPMEPEDRPPEGFGLQEGFDEDFHPRGRAGQFVKSHRRAMRSLKTGRQRPPAMPGTTLAKIAELGLDKEPEPTAAALEMLGGHRNSANYWHAHRERETEDSPAYPPYKAVRRRRHNLIVGQFLAGLPTPHHPARGVAALLGVDHPIVQKLAKGGRLTEAEKDVVRQAAHNERGGESPDALFMAGGPASGKSTLLEDNPELEPAASVRVDPDEIKEHLPEFQKLRAMKDHYAATAVHLESGDIAMRLQMEAGDLGLNTVIDGTGDSEPQDFTSQLQAKHDEGYDVNVLYANIPTEEAIVRAVQRAEETGRFVPVPVIREQHAKVSRNFPYVVGLPWLENVDVFSDGKHVGGKERTAWRDFDPEKMQQFRAKEGELHAR